MKLHPPYAAQTLGKILRTSKTLKTFLTPKFAHPHFFLYLCLCNKTTTDIVQIAIFGALRMCKETLQEM